MTLLEEIEKWNAKYRYDFWYRDKYKIAFGSKEHRELNQIDISFAYFEHHLYNKAIDKFRMEEEKKKKFKESGMWISETKISESEEDKLWANADLSKLKNL